MTTDFFCSALPGAYKACGNMKHTGLARKFGAREAGAALISLPADHDADFRRTINRPSFM
jgi:hypothetical protein